MSQEQAKQEARLEAPREAPAWVDREEYPFRPRYFDTGRGRISFVDEGDGEPVVMVHGNPAWSFLYRNLVKDLSPSHRCIVPDHLGFGLSDKPDLDYAPALHADNLEALIDALELETVNLVVHDWGGPIGLSFARRHPGRVRRVVLFNTWAWPVQGDLYYWGFSRFMGGPIGRYLIRRHDFFVRGVMKMARGEDESAWTELVMEHYRRPQATARDRKASMVLPAQILEAGDWLDDLWSHRETFVELPFLVLWGSADIAFRQKELGVWRQELRQATVRVLEGAGHYVQEERHRELRPDVLDFLSV
jgi:haloalkane dehalogenase